jgi:uncharacterized protein (TIGR02284 family)
MSNDKVIETLNLLIRTSRDGEAGFRACAEQLQSRRLRELLLSRAADCARAVDDLKPIVQRLGGTPMEGTSAPGDVHRAWLVGKAALTGSDDLAVMNECERGEDIALADYRKALDEDLPADIRQVVESQMRGAQHNHDQVKALRDALARGESPEGAMDYGTAGNTGDDGRRGEQAASGEGAQGGFMHWTLTQVRLHPFQALGVAALVGVLGWAAMSARGGARMLPRRPGFGSLALGGLAASRASRMSRMFR